MSVGVLLRAAADIPYEFISTVIMYFDLENGFLNGFIDFCNST